MSYRRAEQDCFGLCMMKQRQRRTPSFAGLGPASKNASAAARGASRKTDTRCELVLRRELWSRGLRYRLHVAELPGRPDIVFPPERVVVFCDGDFWHGRDLESRIATLSRGHNSTYWVTKVQRNVARDRKNQRTLEAAGWTVVRIWETDLMRAPGRTADSVAKILADRRAAQITL
jgi:DNA mismatch endonuclease, patch repair protein